jgi:glutathione S-transferase
MEYVSVEDAIGRPGLRIAFTRGVPGPWSEAAKAFLQIKGVPFTAVAQEGAQANEALQAWTGQNAAPVAVYENERPRSHWSEILMLAERLAPTPRLVPADEDERMLNFGIAHELCGEDGFGWNCRLLMLDAMERAAGVTPETTPFTGMRRKYTSGTDLDHARTRILAIMAMLACRLQDGRSWLVGEALSAADIYWTTFSNLVAPMADADCPMPEFYRTTSVGRDPVIEGRVPEILLAHRERILHDYFTLPMSF